MGFRRGTFERQICLFTASKILCPRGESCLQNTHYNKQEGPCLKRTLDWTWSACPLLILAIATNAPFWTPRTKFMCLIPWERTPGRIHMNFLWVAFRVKKGVPKQGIFGHEDMVAGLAMRSDNVLANANTIKFSYYKREFFDVTDVASLHQTFSKFLFCKISGLRNWNLQSRFSQITAAEVRLLSSNSGRMIQLRKGTDPLQNKSPIIF